MTRWMIALILMGTGGALAQVPSSPISFAAKQIQYPQQHGTIDIELGHTQLLKLDRQFKSIVIGNPKVADVVVEDQRTILINAKMPDDKDKQKSGNTTPGGATTNLILLDNANEPIYSADIIVHGEQAPPAVTSLANVRIFGVSGGSGISGSSGGAAGSGASASSGSSRGSGSSGGKLSDYVPFACGARDCVVLNAEHQNELSRGIYTTGVAHYDSNYTMQSNSPSPPPPPNAPGS